MYAAMANSCVGVDENMKLTDCYYEKKDWRACKKEVSECVGRWILELVLRACLLPRRCRAAMREGSHGNHNFLIVHADRMLTSGATDGGLSRMLEES